MLEPAIAALLESLKDAPEMHTLGVDALRRQMREKTQPSTVETGAITDLTIPAPVPLAARLYTPAGADTRALAIFFHGGGFVMGDLDTHDDLCRRLANGASARVLAIDYRLAPEHKFPAAVEDAVAAIAWAAANAQELGADPRQLAVAGDSAGANLATVAAIRLRGTVELRAQLLFYPVTDHHSAERPSYRDNAEGYFLSRQDMIAFWTHYLPSEADKEHPDAAPIRAPDLSAMPRTMILTAEFDPLRDEGEEYGRRLAAEGNAVTIRPGPGLIHGFARMSAISPGSAAALADACQWLRDSLRLPE